VKKAILCILLLILLGQDAWALDFQHDKYADELITQITNDTLNTEYEKAIGRTRELINQYPREPFPRFLLTSICMYMLRSYWDFSMDEKFWIYRKEFEDAAAEARRVCDEYPVQNAMVEYVRGMVFGEEGMVHLQNKEWLEAYSKGKAGVAALEKSLAMDPENFDAYLGLGMFEYYCSKLSGVTKILAWIVGFRGNSEKGIEYVTKAMNYGRYAEGPAKVFLAYVLIDFDNKLDEGVKLASSLRAKYPRNYVFIEYLLRAAKKLPPERAGEGIGWIETYIKTSNWRNEVVLFAPYNLDTVDYVEASLYLAEENYTAAQNLLEPILARARIDDEFGTNVYLALLQVYNKTESCDKAERLYSIITGSKSINNSHAKAREIQNADCGT
jgi:tetratricopeptide (TPR) repeat protein